MLINDNDCDLEDLEEADLPDDSPETRMYIIAQARLSQTGKFPAR